MANLRIEKKVDLQRIFGDERKVGITELPETATTIQDLHDHLSYVYDITIDYHIFIDEYFVSNKERLEILNGKSDIVTLIPATIASIHGLKPIEAKKLKLKKRKKREREIEDQKEDKTKHAPSRQTIFYSPQESAVHVSTTHESDSFTVPSNRAVEVFRRPVKPMTISSTPKIVKAVIIHDDVMREDSSRTSLVSTYPQDADTTEVSDVQQQNVDDEQGRRKRTRPRTRKRKRTTAVNHHSFQSDTSFITQDVPSPCFIASPIKNSHIWFDHVDDEIIKGIKRPYYEKKSPILLETETTTIHNGYGTDKMNPSVDVVEVNLRTEDNEIINITSEIDVEKYHREILNYPIMKTVFPKVGDILGFKIYYISENFTPQLSDFILAKVLNWDPHTTHIVVDILYGLEQIRSPSEGKFVMNDGENDTSEANKEVSSHKEFGWSEILEPRLLFP